MATRHLLESAARRPRAAAGFTLIELLVVLLMIAMVSGLVGLALRDGGAPILPPASCSVAVGRLRAARTVSASTRSMSRRVVDASSCRFIASS